MANNVFLFVILMRALGAIIITNAHYTGVYPTDLIANGGLLGDVIFFAVSGFCLANTKGYFPKWYLKRFVRIYIPSWLMTLIYMALGIYVVTGLKQGLNFFLWPTHWHFVASIILLYIPFFFVSKYIEMNRKNYNLFAISLFIIQIILYLFMYDRSYYHIDNVREPMIEFLFFQSMVLGLHYRWRCDNENILQKPFRFFLFILSIFVFGVYFICKIHFVNVETISDFQILNQFVLWILLYVLFRFFMSIENKLKNIERKKTWSVVKFISDHTLEIYIVQYVILDYCKRGPFPLNWLMLTTIISISAILLRLLSQQIIEKIKL